MKPKIKNAFHALKELGCPVVDSDRGNAAFIIDADGGNEWADYYTNPLNHDSRLTEIAGNYNLFLDWIDPGTLGAYDED